jgi:hypothetical protein
MLLETFLPFSILIAAIYTWPIAGVISKHRNGAIPKTAGIFLVSA